MLARFACVLLFAIFAEPSSAQGYLGFSVGQTSNDAVFKLFAGHQFTPDFAAEFAYGALGRVTRGTDSATLEAADWSAIVSWPVSNRFSVHGRFGIYYGGMQVTPAAVADTDNTLPVPIAPPGGMLSPPPPAQPTWQSGTKTGITFGLGASHAMSDRAFLRLDWQRYADFAPSGPKLDVDLLSLGALFRF
jgi:hypothetical protein